MVQSIQITFFSGTGGVQRIADAFEREILERGLGVRGENLDYSMHNRRRQPSETTPSAAADLILLLFPLHAFDAPEPVYDWINRTSFSGRQVAVISVSGGGEAWPNTGCRDRCCRAIEEKGGRVLYERMLCMPSNWVFEVNEHAAMHLINAIPRKVKHVLDEVLAGKVRRSRARLSVLRAWVSRLEKEHAAEFPRDITVSAACNGCAVCENHCPVQNIHLQNGRPLFGAECVMCFRCIYACPAHAMQTGNFMVLKNGYDLRGVERRMQGVKLEPVEKCAAGFMWTAIRDYLLDRD